MNRRNFLNIVSIGTAITCGILALLSACAKDIKMPLPAGARTIEVGENAPVKTLADALAKVAEVRRTDVTTPLALRLAPGDYYTPASDKSIEITEAHASTNFAPLIIYAADFSRKPHLHGGATLTGWKKVPFNGRDDVWVAEAAMLKGHVPQAVLYNGRKMSAARWPNLDVAGNPYRGGYTLIGDPDAPAGVDPKSLAVYEDELWRRPEDVRTWAHPEDGTAIVFPLHYYHTFSFGIAGTSNRVVRLKGKRVPLKGLHRYDMWHVVNIAEELDLPGEWYFNPRELKLYLITPDGSDPNGVSVTAMKRAQPVVKILDAANCTIAGLEISGGGDGIRIVGGSDLNILACSIHDIGGDLGDGGTGVHFRSRRTRIVDCDIFNVGNHGLFQSGFNPHLDARSAATWDDNVIANNYIHHCGRNGMFNFAVRATIRNNLIHDTGSSAISGFGRFCDISYNRMRHVAIVAQDVGAMYDSGWGTGTGTHIRYNWISDVVGKNRNDHYLGACGIYFDECTGGSFVYGNLVEHAHWAAMHLHCGRWITITNNIFVSNGNFPVGPHSCQFSYGNWGPGRRGFSNLKLHVAEYDIAVRSDPNWKKYPAYSQDAHTDEIYDEDGYMMMGNRFEGNIVYYPDQGGSGKMLNGNHLNLTTNIFNRNVYWAGREKNGAVREVFMNRHAKEGMTFDLWQKDGGDTDSVIADPLFVDPVKGNYRLKPDSPALKMGFVQLPFEEMGLQKTFFRPVLPVEAEGLREHPEWLDPAPPIGRTTKVMRPKEYLIINLSKGPSADKYSVATVAPDAVKTIGDAFKTDKLLLAKIPAGIYDMQGYRPVTLTKDFYMGVFEMTQKQYERVTGKKPSRFKGDMRPVESVSYNEITNFCAILSCKTGLDITLPTEAQWEYACRAGTATRYNNGTDKPDGLCRNHDTQTDGAGGYAEHTTVGSYKPNAWGLYDMHGNVWEVCTDMMDWDLRRDPVTDPTGPRPRVGGYNTIRGGSWVDFAPCTTSRTRFYNWPDHRHNTFGFRIIAR